MLEPLEVYVLVQRDGRWWLPYGPEADTNALSHVFSSECSVVFSDLVRRRMIWNSRADFVADGLGSSVSGYAT